MTDDRGLLDTSVLIAHESGRSVGSIPAQSAISVVTIAALQVGVLMTDDPDVRARRLQTLGMVQAAFQTLPIDERVAQVFAGLAAGERRAGRSPKIMDMWIAATAVAHALPLYTRDRDQASIATVRSVIV